MIQLFEENSSFKCILPAHTATVWETYILRCTLCLCIYVELVYKCVTDANVSTSCLAVAVPLAPPLQRLQVNVCFRPDLLS